MDTLSYKTISANKETATKEWVVVDATDQVVGRLGAKVAKLLRGKYKPNFTPQMRMENDLIARKLNLLTVFFPALAPSYKEIILNSFDQYSLLKAYVRRIMDSYPGIQAEDHEKLEKALTQSLRDSEVDCIHKYLSAKFSDEAIDALVKEMEGRHDE